MMRPSVASTTSRPLFLRGVSEETRASGVFRDSLNEMKPPQRLLWGDKNYRIATRAADADVVLLAASRFDEYPDLHVTDSTFKSLSKVSNGGAQMQPVHLGHERARRRSATPTACR